MLQILCTLPTVTWYKQGWDPGKFASVSITAKPYATLTTLGPHRYNHGRTFHIFHGGISKEIRSREDPRIFVWILFMFSVLSFVWSHVGTDCFVRIWQWLLVISCILYRVHTFERNKAGSHDALSFVVVVVRRPEMRLLCCNFRFSYISLWIPNATALKMETG